MTKSEKPDGIKGYENTQWFAKFFNRSERLIQDLANDGVLQAKKIKGKYYYPVIPTIQSFINYQNEIIDRRKKTSEDQEKEKLEADIRFRRAKANKAEIDLEVFKNNLIPSEIVKAYIEDLATKTRALLLGLPGRLSIDVMNTGSPAEASEVIKKALNDVLVELEGCEFSIKAYKERVGETESANFEDDDELD